MVCSEENLIDGYLLEMCTGLKAHQVDHLSDAIERLLGTGKGETPILKIQCINDILLICVENGNSHVHDHQIQFIRDIYSQPKH